MLKRKKVRNGLIIGVLALIVMGAVLWFVVLSPRIAVADELAAQTQQVEMNNLALHNQYNQTLADAQKASLAATEAQALFSKMPQEAELPQILQDITDAASRAGIDGASLRTVSTSVPLAVTPPAGSDAGVNLASMNIGITAVGTHKQVMEFLGNLEGLDRALLIVTAGVSAEGDTNEVLQVDGSMFILQSTLPDLVTTVDDLLKQAEAEGAIPTPGVSAAPSAGAPSAGATPLPSASSSSGSVPAPLSPAASPTALPTAS